LSAFGGKRQKTSKNGHFWAKYDEKWQKKMKKGRKRPKIMNNFELDGMNKDCVRLKMIGHKSPARHAATKNGTTNGHE